MKNKTKKDNAPDANENLGIELVGIDLIKHNPDTGWCQVKDSGDDKTFWISPKLATIIIKFRTAIRAKDAMRKSRDYYRTERETYRRILQEKDNEITAMKSGIEFNNELIAQINDELDRMEHKRNKLLIYSAIAVVIAEISGIICGATFF